MGKTACRPLRRDMLPNPVDIQVVGGKVTLAKARDIAQTKAQEVHSEVMLLAWFDQITGAYSPHIEC
jgi:hypothetical protein